MHIGLRIACVLFAAAGIALTAEDVDAQVNCGAAPSPQARANCYYQMQQIYLQQQRLYNDSARQQWQQYQNAPQYIKPLRVIPGAGRIVGPATQAWRAPGYYYQYRYGRP